LAWKPPSAITAAGAMNFFMTEAAPCACCTSTSTLPKSSFRVRARVPRRMRPWRLSRFASSRCSAMSPP
jgi:hypothetical protein